MLPRSGSIFPVEGQHDAKRHSGQALAGTQLVLDGVWELENIDILIRSRQKGTRPGLARLLTLRRDVMAALAAQLRPDSGEGKLG